LGEGLRTPDRKDHFVSKSYAELRAGSCEHGNEPSGSIKGGELHAPAALLPGKESLVPIG